MLAQAPDIVSEIRSIHDPEYDRFGYSFAGLALDYLCIHVCVLALRLDASGASLPSGSHSVKYTRLCASALLTFLIVVISVVAVIVPFFEFRREPWFDIASPILVVGAAAIAHLALWFWPIAISFQDAHLWTGLKQSLLFARQWFPWLALYEVALMVGVVALGAPILLLVDLNSPGSLASVLALYAIQGVLTGSAAGWRVGLFHAIRQRTQTG